MVQNSINLKVDLARRESHLKEIFTDAAKCGSNLKSGTTISHAQFKAISTQSHVIKSMQNMGLDAHDVVSPTPGEAANPRARTCKPGLDHYPVLRPCH